MLPGEALNRIAEEQERDLPFAKYYTAVKLQK